jgi:hypothetical protein
MANCLRPCGIPRKAFLPNIHSLLHDVDVPFEDKDLMPAHTGSYIRTKKGTRRLLHDELAKGLGVPSTWLDKEYPDGRLMEQSIGVHIFEYLTPALQEKPLHNRNPPLTDGTFSPGPFPNILLNNTTDDSHGSDFHWVPPNLMTTGIWHKKRVYNLKRAALQCHREFGEDPATVIADGMRALEHHRSNYTATHPEPKHLQLLWWEFPPEHWFDLRHGSPMNFLEEPPLGIQPTTQTWARPNSRLPASS